MRGCFRLGVLMDDVFHALVIFSGFSVIVACSYVTCEIVFTRAWGWLPLAFVGLVGGSYVVVVGFEHFAP